MGGEGLARGAVDVLTMRPVPLRTEAEPVPVRRGRSQSRALA